MCFAQDSLFFVALTHNRIERLVEKERKTFKLRDKRSSTCLVSAMNQDTPGFVVTLLKGENNSDLFESAGVDADSELELL